ncbi:uncharacterized protein LOC128718496 [Anopheles marshallii]|uniref:uncharacterized protein LOC128718496 n=1 Tax=Anopheles marshallii TaxID=1521116 RepID=UPI00237BDAEF|nr:uncharacterized protein LOC128718496 [Anopheles marshallii]
MTRGIRIPLILFCCLLLAAYTDSKLIIHMKKVEIVNNPKYANATANIRHYGPSLRSYVADFRLETLQTFFIGMVTTIYYVPNMAGRYDKAFYNRTINFCTYLRQPLTDRILKLVYEKLNQRGNLPKRCPILAGTYSFNTSFDSFNLPGFLPESSFRFDLNFHRGPPSNELIFHGYWYGELRRVSS